MGLPLSVRSFFKNQKINFEVSFDAEEGKKSYDSLNKSSFIPSMLKSPNLESQQFLVRPVQVYWVASEMM